MTKAEKISKLMKRLWNDPVWVANKLKRRTTKSYRNKISKLASGIEKELMKSKRRDIAFLSFGKKN